MPIDTSPFSNLIQENEILKKEIRVSRQASEITADLVVKQFEETEKILQRFQIANAQRKAVLDSATHISIIATNKEGIIIVFNTGAENLLGYHAGEIIGKERPEIFHLKSELSLIQQELNIKLDRKIEEMDLFFEFGICNPSELREWTYVRKDGTRFPVQMSINPLKGSDGLVSGFLCIALDVSDKKRSKKALQESTRNYRLLIRNLPSIVYRGYLDGSIDFFDDKIEKLSGYSKEDFLSRKIRLFDLICEEDRKYAQQIFIQALKTDHSYIRDYRLKSKSGNIVWIEERGQIIYGENGEVEYITGSFLDITERKLAEKALHESEEKYRSLFNSGPNPIFVLDQSTYEIRDANPSAEETYGYSKEELIGRPFTDFGKFDHGDSGSNPLRLDKISEACVISHKVRHYKKNKKPIFVRITACPTRYKERSAIILAITDITETVEKDAQLIQASKMTTLGEMSAGIAHELNQPLNAIKMGNEFLKVMIEKGREVPEKDLRQVASEVSDQVDRATKIINRLREFSRKPDPAEEKVNINNPLRGVLGIVVQQLKLQNIEITLGLEENLPPILAQSNRLEQVFFNLISNARDAIIQKETAGYVAFDRTIAIRTFQESDKVAVTVSDTGIGIPKENLDKVFEPFYTTKEVGQGMGLGLYIIYGIVKDYHGDIDIQSKEGIGTTIKHTFPAISE